VIVDALTKGRLADVEGKGLGESSAVGYSPVGTDTGVGERVLGASQRESCM
jgi:hypothetical protein